MPGTGFAPGALDSSCTLFSQDFSLSRPATSSHESAPQTSPFQRFSFMLPFLCDRRQLRSSLHVFSTPWPCQRLPPAAKQSQRRPLVTLTCLHAYFSCKIFPSQATIFPPTLCPHKSFRCNT